MPLLPHDPYALDPNQSVKPLGYKVDSAGNPVLSGVNLLDLARTHGTPLYVLDETSIRAAANAYCDSLKQVYSADSLPLFACKSNFSMGIAKLMQKLGMGLDVVSGGELYTALQAGFPMEKVLFNGNNKTLDELDMAIEHGVHRISVDNFHDLILIDRIAVDKFKGDGTKVNVLLRITPGIECHTHDYIKTGQEDSKFGFDMGQLPKAIDAILNEYSSTIQLCGLHAHIGSQIFETRPYEDLVEIMLNIYYNIRESYHGLVLSDLDLGGGLGICYQGHDDPPSIRDAMAQIAKKLVSYAEKLDYPLPRLLLEPGRSMIGTAGVTLYTVGSIKTIPNVRKFVAVDGGMGDNIRPALYQADYTAQLANKLTEPIAETVTVVGKYCESGDVLIREISLPQVEAGDILMVFGTGAYNYSMSSNYNRMPRPAMILVENAHAHTLLNRETYDTLIQQDAIPRYLRS